MIKEFIIERFIDKSKRLYHENINNVIRQVIANYEKVNKVTINTKKMFSFYKNLKEQCQVALVKYIKKTGTFRHVKGEAIDIAPSSIRKGEKGNEEKYKIAFHQLLAKIKKDKIIDEYLSPYTKAKDPAFHIVLYKV